MEEGYHHEGWVQSRVRSASPDYDDDDDEDVTSDEGPLLAYKYDRYGRARRRSACSVVARAFLLCGAVLACCILLYIPLYDKASHQVPRSIVAGWSYHTNRDTKIYVQPNNVTTLHEPITICKKHEKKKLYLLIVVCSSTVNFDRRSAIRETWGSYKTYLETKKIFTDVKEKYKNYNFSYDLYPTEVINVTRVQRDVGFGSLLPKLAEALKNNIELNSLKENTEKVTELEEKRFSDENMLPEFDMTKLSDQNVDNDIENYDLDYESNVMKIPPNGFEKNADLDMVLTQLKKAYQTEKNGFSQSDKNGINGQPAINGQPDINGQADINDQPDIDVSNPDFKVVFLLGLPQGENSTETQSKIDEEVERYGDIIQESFIDSYNNLTLKSIMMLKWVTQHCNESVRYILKTDDDMFINVPNLMVTLNNKTMDYEAKKAQGRGDPEYMLIGDLICGAKPVTDATDKWFSPRYMFSGRVYPRYLSGTGYAVSLPAAGALYRAALETPYFHLEDIYITGICSMRATPRIPPRDAPGFSYSVARRGLPCAAHARVTLHAVSGAGLRHAASALQDPELVDRCEKIYLTQVRRDRLKPKRAKNAKKSALVTRSLVT